MYVTAFFMMLVMQPLESVTLTVVLDEIKNSQGSVLVCLCNELDVFTETCFKSASASAVQGQQSIIFEDLPPGPYGISVLHDRNDNGEMDKNFLGLPKEPFGFSEVSGLIVKLPSFEQCKFDLEGSMTVKIKMR